MYGASTYAEAGYGESSVPVTAVVFTPSASATAQAFPPEVRAGARVFTPSASATATAFPPAEIKTDRNKVFTPSASASAEAFPPTLIFAFSGTVPRPSVTFSRSNDYSEVTIDIDNYIDGFLVEIWRADSFSSTFSLIDTVLADQYVDDSINAEGNYKYKVRFVRQSLSSKKSKIEYASGELGGL